MAEMFAHMATLARARPPRATRGDARLRRCRGRGRRQPRRRGRLLHGRAVRGLGGGGVPGAARLHRLDPRRQHGHRRARLAAPHRAEDPLRELLRLRRDRQVGAARRHREAEAACATPARRTGSSGTPASSTASCFRSAPASTTGRRRSGTGSGCSRCSRARSRPDRGARGRTRTAAVLPATASAAAASTGRSRARRRS